MSTTIDSAVLAERRRMQAQIRAIGLQQDATITWGLAEREAVAGETLPPVVDELAPVEIRNALVRFRDVEFRDASGTGDGSYTLTGYAAVYEQETILYDGSWWRLREVIAPGAFDNVLATDPDVHLNIGHDMTRAIARTGVDGVGGLELSSDDEGLRVFARLDPADPDVVSLAAKMNRGIVDQMSFAFTIARAQYDSTVDEDDFEDELRTILEIGQLYDTAVCAQGAYPQTSAELAMRSLMGTRGRAINLAGLLERRGDEPGDEPPAAPPVSDDTPSEPTDDSSAEAERAAQAAAAQRARTATAMRIRIANDDD